MKEPMLSIPVTCPTCGKDQLESFPEAMVEWNVNDCDRMYMHSTCHPQQWKASPLELHQLREYLGINAIKNEPGETVRWDLMTRLLTPAPPMPKRRR